MPIKNYPREKQPREKALSEGISSLEDAELLALFLRTGYKNVDVLSLANLLLSKFKDLNQLSKITINEIKSIQGIGIVKAIEIVALFEMSRRIKNRSIQTISNVKDAINIARQLIPNYFQEHFIILVLSKDNKIIYKKKIISGKEDSVTLSPKIILSEIIKRDGFGFYCFHNHPSNNKNPSDEDVIMTETLIYYCDLFKIIFLGHYILTETSQNKIITSDTI